MKGSKITVQYHPKSPKLKSFKGNIQVTETTFQGNDKKTVIGNFEVCGDSIKLVRPLKPSTADEVPTYISIHQIDNSYFYSFDGRFLETEVELGFTL